MSDSRCAEVRRFVGPYIDGEFDERDAALFEEHLSHCADCRAYFDEQTWLLNAVKPILQRPTRMPPQVRRRIEENIEKARRPERSQRLIRYLTHPLPVAIVATGLLFFVRPGFQPAETDQLTTALSGEEVAVRVEAPITRVNSTAEGVPEAVNQHIQALPIERPTPEHSDVERWFAEKLPFDVNALRFRDHRVNLLGGRISRFRAAGMGASEPAARLFYQVGGHKMSVLVLKENRQYRGRNQRGGAAQGEIRIHDYGQHRVATFTRNGLTYMLTSELGPEDMKSVIESAR